MFFLYTNGFVFQFARFGMFFFLINSYLILNDEFSQFRSWTMILKRTLIWTVTTRPRKRSKMPNTICIKSIYR